MKIRSLRLPEDLLRAIAAVGQTEHIDEAPAIRKLLRLGLETHVAGLYGAGRLTLREAAQRLGLSLGDTIDLLRERGVSGNLTATDVLESIDRFTNTPPTATAVPNAPPMPGQQPAGQAGPAASMALDAPPHADAVQAVVEAPCAYPPGKGGT